MSSCAIRHFRDEQKKHIRSKGTLSCFRWLLTTRKPRGRQQRERRKTKDLFSRTIAKHMLFKAQHYIYMLYRSEDVVPSASRAIGVSLRGKQITFFQER